MYAEFGYFYSKRIDMKLTPQLKESLAEKLANPPKSIGELTVREVNKTDGVKLIFDDSNWRLCRLSGTEPVARIYAEACSPRDLKNVLDAGKKWALS
jgi:phosphoglucomutase